ncbi:hypothetical protein HK100_010280 [Physocladia obscura]|uniref:Uncharacterized protein n=1 Tax=Physocladia obscura TaxID=109957 RepID=A0AAD5SMI6_9FUNG|nr:hypothetical protein HK100_010280 [Physocladia obscura]
MNAKTLPTVEFNGTAADLKTTLWATAVSELKGKATVNSSCAVQNESGGVKIKNFADFIVVLKNQCLYSFGVVARPLWTIKDNMMGTLAAGDRELTVFIYAYSRSVGKSTDYEKVIRSINGGLEGIDRSGAPNELQFNTIIEQLETYHPHLQGENMIWRDWACILLRNPSTLQQAMQLPPPVEITNLFDRQLRSEAQVSHIQQSLTIALNIIKDQEDVFESLKQKQEYYHQDWLNQYESHRHQLRVHKQAVMSFLNAVSPSENENAVHVFNEIKNMNDFEYEEDDDDWEEAEE